MQIGGVTFGGLASGIDTKALIQAIIQAERKPIERLEARQVELNQQKSALDEMRSKLSGFLNTLKDLNTQGTFSGRTTSVSDETVFTASAAPGAELGLFSIEVLELAAANKVKSDGFSASDSGLVSDGTITIQSGSNDPITIDVSSASGNNSLQAVRDAINDADAGVQASVLFDGTDYRLIVRAEESGVDNALTITDGTNLNLDLAANEIVAAADSRITVDGIEVTSSSNKISGALSGVTINLLNTTSGTPVTLGVADDVAGVVEAVQGLTSSYNEAIKFLNSQLDTNSPGPLARDSYARSLQQKLQTFVTTGVDGIPFGEIRSLASIGVSFDGRSGELSVNTADLTELLEERFDEVGRLFQAVGSAVDARIQFVSGSPDTVAGDYAVEITQAAEQASVSGSTRIKNSGLKDPETLTITVGSDSVDVDLAANDKLSDVVSKINSALSTAGIDASAGDDGAGKLQITTGAYGSDVSISVTSSVADPGNGRQTGFDLTPTTDAGLDVAGKIDGVDAVGAGQLLTADEGSSASGLTVRVNATAADVIATGGDFGLVSYSPGLSDRFIGELTEATRFGDGRIDSSQEIIKDQLKNLSDEIDRMEERLVAREARLVRTFGAAEQAIALLQSQQSQLGTVFSG